MAGTINTVTGPVKSCDLGITLTHEHLHMQFDCAYTKVPGNISKIYPLPNSGLEGFTLKNLGIIRQYPFGLPYNLKMDDEDTKSIMFDEIQRFGNAGGRTIVENTIRGLSRDINFLHQLSVQSGLNIVAGTGYYVHDAQTQSDLSKTVEEMHDFMLKELTSGCDENIEIKCGILGEIASSWPIHDFEKRVIQATAQVQSVTQAPVTFHPGRNSKAPQEILRIFTEAGGKSKDCIMSHLDRTFTSDEELLEFAGEFKTFTQFDLFGIECSYYQLADVDMVSDAQRIMKLKCLKENGHLDQILMSHDIYAKHRLVNFGGHGFAHILLNIIPKMKLRGFTQNEIDTILIKNPKRWLTKDT